VVGLGSQLARLTRGTLFRLVAAIALAGGCAIGCASTASQPSAHCKAAVPNTALARTLSDAPPAVPARGAYFGAFALDGSTFTQQQFISSVANLEIEICRPLAIVHSYLQWNKPFPSLGQLDASRSGQTILLSWTGTDMSAMASGADDQEILAVAREVSSLRSPVFVELRWEMDRPNLASVVHSPATFIAAWDRTRALFRQADVSNASWVWCPTATGFDRGVAPSYYPGASEVDWICTDAYPTPGGPVEQLKSEVAAFLTWAKGQGKPIMLGEIGVPQNYSSPARVKWIENAANFVEQTPQIKAVVYFDYNPVGHSSTRDYLITPGTPAAAALRALGADPWFNPSPT
jgi:hypothetical protein